MATVSSGYKEVKHLSFDIGAVPEHMSPQEAEGMVAELLAKGWEIIHVSVPHTESKWFQVVYVLAK